MGLTADEAIAILVDVVNGVEVPVIQSIEERDYREKVTAEVAAIAEQGGIVEIPYEISDEDLGR